MVGGGASSITHIIIIIALQLVAEGLLQSEAAWWNMEKYKIAVAIERQWESDNDIELVVQFDEVMTQLHKSRFGLWEAGWALTWVKVGTTVFRIKLCHELFPEEFC